MTNIKHGELLSPAGSMEALRAAVNNGCDAVYFGGKSFSARYGADNFDNGELAEAIEYCHMRGVKAYLTVNTLYRNDEIDGVMKLCGRAYRLGIDAFIVQDFGTSVEMRRYFPGVAMHASTQMTAHSLGDVEFLQECGFDRVVLARELSLEDIKNIAAHTSCELEVFIHGALCVCFSGQCLMSSFLGERSGNRGRCAQTCRLDFQLLKDGEVVESGCLLSPRDMMTLDKVREITGAGVTALKIEGRMRSPEYVAVATRMYREMLDGAMEVPSEEMVRKLTQIFNRGGYFSGGYFNSYAGRDMMSTETSKSTGLLVGEVLRYDEAAERCTIIADVPLIPGDGIEIWTEGPHVGAGINKPVEEGKIFTINIKGGIQKGDKVYRSFDKSLGDEARHSYVKDTRRLPVEAEVVAHVGSPLHITLTHGYITVTKEGAVVEKAQNAPVTAEKLLAQLEKSGDTTFAIKIVYSDIDGGIYIGIRDINELRRDALGELQRELAADFLRDRPAIYQNDTTVRIEDNKKLTASVRTKEQFDGISRVGSGISRIYLETSPETMAELHYYIEECKKQSFELYMALPHIYIEDSALGSLEDMLARMKQSGIDGCLARSWWQLTACEEAGLEIAADYTLNVYNSLSRKRVGEWAGTVALSVELNLQQIATIDGIGTEIIIHGKTPLMITRQCPVGLYAGGKSSGRFCKLKGNADGYTLKDRKGVEFPILCDCSSCMARIINPAAVFTANKIYEILKTPVEYLRLAFTVENGQDTENIARLYTHAVFGNGLSEQDKELIDRYIAGGVTNGHFHRGAL